MWIVLLTYSLLVVYCVPRWMIEHATETQVPWLSSLGLSYLGGFGVDFWGGMAFSRRSDTKMPAMATAQSAREILRRVFGGRTRTVV